MPRRYSAGVADRRRHPLRFDDYPDPDARRSRCLLLTTGFFWVPGAYGVDLIDKPVTFRPPGQPVRQLGLHHPPPARARARCRVPGRPLPSGRSGPATGPAGRPGRLPTCLGRAGHFRCRVRGGGCHLDTTQAPGGCFPRRRPACRCAPAEAWAALVEVPSRQDRCPPPGRRRRLRAQLPAAQADACTRTGRRSPAGRAASAEPAPAPPDRRGACRAVAPPGFDGAAEASLRSSPTSLAPSVNGCLRRPQRVALRDPHPAWAG